MNTITAQTAHKVFRYGTHEQLENSIKRWLKKGIATEVTDKFYDIKKPIANAQEIEINVRGRYSSPIWKAHAVVVKDNNGWYLLAGSI